ncbi:protein of unknown function [Candidatus Hydrogenisulfobacillus filiaventi]|uniref:Uncharacterized protein n=1 Tax=Candidatus Hydrogenisulfobacillus filiaventi TaxID=2707344 RepID=A0A6F8ZJ53_9FIRM|nr:protein of unknown function [Candidatus Hydrogenisulfobacillus filiaventi]
MQEARYGAVGGMAGGSGRLAGTGAAEAEAGGAYGPAPAAAGTAGLAGAGGMVRLLKQAGADGPVPPATTRTFAQLLAPDDRVRQAVSSILP